MILETFFNTFDHAGGIGHTRFMFAGIYITVQAFQMNKLKFYPWFYCPVSSYPIKYARFRCDILS
jgi:hypothetical protein